MDIVRESEDNIDNVLPVMSDAQIIEKGLVITSATNSDTVFETLDVVDFTTSSSNDAMTISNTDENGLVTEYKVTKKVRAISGETKTKSFTIGSPEKFKRLTLPETNVIEILDCKGLENGAPNESNTIKDLFWKALLKASPDILLKLFIEETFSRKDKPSKELEVGIIVLPTGCEAAFRSIKPWP